jgi:uncharacterized protein (UPF0332 family)
VSQKEVIAYWLEKADQDLASARGNLLAGRLQNCVRDAYFACFHALCPRHPGRTSLEI